MALSPAFQLLSSTRYDTALLDVAWNTAANEGIQSSYLLLRYQCDRLHGAAKEHGWTTAQDFTYDDMKQTCDNAVHAALHDLAAADAPLKIRILLGRTGSLTVSASRIAPLSDLDPASVSLLDPQSIDDHEPPTAVGTLLSIYPDSCPSLSSIFTRTKTTHRPEYTAARQRIGIPPLPAPSTADVLLYTPSGELTETSIRNIAFLRGTPLRWVTPRTEIGCLPGVMRRWLLEQGRVVEACEGELMKENLLEGEYVMTFNGVEGCRLGRVMFPSH